MASQITQQYIKHDKKPQNLEGWKELKHIFKKWKNIIYDKEKPIKNPQYVAWFRRNCTDNIPEFSKVDKINDYLHLDLDINDENSPIRINNHIKLLKKEKESHEQMPYDEWFNKNCEMPTISKNDFILPFEKTISDKTNNKTNKDIEQPLISLKDILESKSNSESLTNDGDEKNKNNPYNEKEMKNIYKFINGLKNNKQKKNVLSSLRNSTDNDIKKNQIDKLNDLIERNMKKEGINHIIEKNKNPKKKEILNNIVDLWDSKNEKEEKEFFDNIENDALEYMPKEDQKKKINDLFNEKEQINEDKEKSLNKLANIMNKFDKDKKQEMMNYLKENNKTPKQEEKLNTLSDILANKEKEDGLIKIFGGNNVRENKDQKEDEQRINEIIENINNLDDKSKSNVLQYMKDTAKNNEEKNKDLNLILNNINLEEKSSKSLNNSLYANDGSYNEENEYNNIRNNLSDGEYEKILSVTDASLRTEDDINIDDLNYSKSQLESIDDVSVFNNDEKLMDAVNEIE